jgi:hypothetical protein
MEVSDVREHPPSAPCPLTRSPLIAYALAVGLAANESMKTQQMVDCEELLKI